MFIREILSALSQARVEYCVVGGVAVNLHGVPRMTYDVDIVVAPTRASLASLAALLADFGLKARQPVDLVALADAGERERLRSELNLIAVTFGDPADPLREVDVLVSPPIDAATLIGRASTLSFAGVAVRVVALDDLIALKRASGRAQDEADVAHLERIRDGGDEHA